MTGWVTTIDPDAAVNEAAQLMIERRVSALPVVDRNERLVGIVSEGDLLHRIEAGTERQRSWWLQAFVHDDTLASEYIKSHSRKVSDVMTREVITASPTMPLHEVAALMEKSAIRRLPVLENGQLVGIVSRANLLQAVASARQMLDVTPSDKAIRDRILAGLKREAWAHTGLLNVTVSNGIVDLWGLAESDTERQAIRVAAESTPGVSIVDDNMVVYRSGGWA